MPLLGGITMKSSAFIKPWKERLLNTSRAGVGEGNRMRTTANSLILHLHPARVPASALKFSYTWGLGGISATLALLLVTTGVLLMFRYEPTVERAYLSIQTAKIFHDRAGRTQAVAEISKESVKQGDKHKIGPRALGKTFFKNDHRRRSCKQ